MASNYPSSLDSLTNPAGTQDTVTVDHAAQHTNANDILEAIEAVLGTTAGTSVLQSFSAGHFPVRATGGGNTGTVVQTLVGGTYNNTVIGTSALTGGTTTSMTHNGATIGTPAITNGTFNNGVIGTPAITGGTMNNSTIGTQNSTGGTLSAVTINNGTLGTPVITGGSYSGGTTSNAFIVTAPAFTGVGTFTGGWTNYAAGYHNVAYMKDNMGFVHLRGVLKSGTPAQSAFTLPTGYRPSAAVAFPALTSSGNIQIDNNLGNVQVDSSGLVVPSLGSVSTFCSLEGMTFYAEQ